MIVSQIYLVTRNARDKVQIVIAELEQNGNSFVIKRTTGQYQGKMVSQPELIIEKGKAKRSVLQQAELEFNSIISKYLDKGYKKLSALTSKKFEDIKNIKHEFVVWSSQILSEIPDLNILGDLPEIKVFNDTWWVWKQIIEETKKKESEASKLYEEEFKNFNWWI